MQGPQRLLVPSSGISRCLRFAALASCPLYFRHLFPRRPLPCAHLSSGVRRPASLPWPVRGLDMLAHGLLWLLSQRLCSSVSSSSPPTAPWLPSPQVVSRQPHRLCVSLLPHPRGCALLTPTVTCPRWPSLPVSMYPPLLPAPPPPSTSAQALALRACALLDQHPWLNVTKRLRPPAPAPGVALIPLTGLLRVTHMPDSFCGSPVNSLTLFLVFCGPDSLDLSQFWHGLSPRGHSAHARVHLHSAPGLSPAAEPAVTSVSAPGLAALVRDLRPL